MKKRILMMDEKDNVGIALSDVEKGEWVTVEGTGDSFQALEKIPSSHKIALVDIMEKQPILRYGEPIGYATKMIHKGDWVHVHNLDAYEIM